MPLTPVEVRHVQLRRQLFRGYGRSAVDQLLNEIADTFEEVWRERADLSKRLDDLDANASKQEELEKLLRSTLVSAERAAQDMKEQARRESDLIVREAHAEGRRVAREAAAEKRRLEEEIRALLRTALESLESLEGRRGEKEKGEKEQQEPVLPATTTQVEDVSGTGIRKIAG